MTSADFQDITPSGSVIVGLGYTTDTINQRILRWTPGGGYTVFDASTFINGTDRAHTSADGNAIIAGLNYWSPGTGVITIQQLLTQSGCDFTGWTLTGAVGISDDGRTIAGNGVSPTGQTQAWVATVPSPGVAIVLGMSVIPCAWRRKR